jgi:hypothetical protein
VASGLSRTLELAVQLFVHFANRNRRLRRRQKIIFLQPTRARIGSAHGAGGCASAAAVAIADALMPRPIECRTMRMGSLLGRERLW